MPTETVPFANSADHNNDTPKESSREEMLLIDRIEKECLELFPAGRTKSHKYDSPMALQDAFNRSIVCFCILLWSYKSVFAVLTKGMATSILVICFDFDALSSV